MFQILTLFIYFLHQGTTLMHNGEAIYTSPSHILYFTLLADFDYI
jgi:hypothetical protein